jgi:c-di-GMP-binding flagellar brake protein YcgR
MSEDNNIPQKKDSGNASDRRTYKRVELVTDFKYDVIPMHFPCESGLIQNISEGGLCLLLDKEFPKGTVLHVEFNLPPENDHIEAIVKVVWQQPIEGQFITGVKFMH